MKPTIKIYVQKQRCFSPPLSKNVSQSHWYVFPFTESENDTFFQYNIQHTTYNIQHNTTQHNTTQHNTTQHNTTQTISYVP